MSPIRVQRPIPATKKPRDDRPVQTLTFHSCQLLPILRTFDWAMPRRALVDSIMAGAPLRRCDHRRRSPNLVTKPAVLRRPRDEPDIFFDVPPHNFVLTLRLRISLCRRTRWRSFGIERSELSKGLANARLLEVGARQGTKLDLGDVGCDNRGPARVENDPLRQFPIGMDADGGGARSFTAYGRPIRHQGIRNEEHREQRTADIEQIS
jgi:hypothetical protein